MSKIRSSGNKATEWRLRALLARGGLRGWKVQPKEVFGSPDFAFVAERLAIFVDGAFWHGAPGFKRFPKSRLHYWKPKIERNKKRDKLVTNRLRRLGWSVLRIWDFELSESPGDIMKRIQTRLRQRKARLNP